jgi:protein-disulfide isomerase
MVLKVTSFAIFCVSLLGGLGGSCEKRETTSEAQKDKPGPEVVLEGVDTSSLTTREKREWSGYVSSQNAPCAEAGTVAKCISDKKNCALCVPAAKYLLKGVRDGQTNEQIDKSYKNRFDPAKVREVKLDDSPSKGPENAAVLVVEWADFECPHCGMMEPMMNKVYSDHKGDTRFAFKFMPLAGHPHGEISARAGFAAFRQGKFWEMHDKMFANQTHLEESDLLSYAKELGLEMTKFLADMKGNEAADRIARDKKLADDLGIKGTPTIYINGRLFEANANPEQSLTDWVNLEIIAKGGTPRSVPGPAVPGPSAAPSLLGSGSAPALKTAAPVGTLAPAPRPKGSGPTSPK